MGELLLLDGITRSSQDVPVAGEDRAGDFAVQREKEGQQAFVKEQLAIAAAKFDAVGELDFVSRGGINLEMVQGVQGMARLTRRRLLRGERSSAPRHQKQGEEKVEPHAGRVFRLGITRQGCLNPAFDVE